MSDCAEPSDWRAPMADESEASRRRVPAPPPRQSSRPPEPRPRTYAPGPARPSLDLPAPPRLIRPSEHLAIVERAMERRPPPLVPTITVVQGPRPALPPPPPVHRPVLPPPMRMPAPVPHTVMRLPQPRRDVQVCTATDTSYYYNEPIRHCRATMETHQMSMQIVFFPKASRLIRAQ
ncbi:leucine-rich repeat extensin-like protein 3 isoform X2 [Ostrinia furnacalis]|uniref:leucine-rich repeat extensin-like protein 3 isoform X2 n=1 Tax=Ostrinia furnacalis TaxID=93504 RepID=UPI00103FDAE0|nr:leucine-rich repeat extensin-like protein 3 isoform X2 [Ostrinia furnacalis]